MQNSKANVKYEKTSISLITMFFPSILFHSLSLTTSLEYIKRDNLL